MYNCIFLPILETFQKLYYNLLQCFQAEADVLNHVSALSQSIAQKVYDHIFRVLTAQMDNFYKYAIALLLLRFSVLEPEYV